VDDVLRLLVTLAIYAVVFVAVGIVFYEVDKRFKRWVNRPRCAVCNARLEGQVAAGGPEMCAACSSRPRGKRRR
jgi:hypothetical protein